MKMSNTVKKGRQGDKLPLKFTGIQSKASCDLRRLQALLTKNSHSQEVATPSPGKTQGRGSVESPQNHTRTHLSGSDACSEAAELEQFSVIYKDQRCFSRHPHHRLFTDILVSLVKNRLCSEWIDHAPPESVLRVLICLRLLIRDPHHQKILHQLHGIHLLAQYMDSVTVVYISCGEQTFAVQKLVTMTYMFQKLSAVESQRAWVIESGAHREIGVFNQANHFQTLVKLLSTTDSSVLLGALLALNTLAESLQCKEEIGELQIVENLLLILQEYDLLSKRMSAELLRLLSPVCQVRDQLRELEGLPVLLSLLHSQHLKLLWSVTWVLVQLCEDPDTRTEIHSWGAVQPLLRLLDSDKQFVCDHLSIEKLSSANAAGRIRRGKIGEEPGKHQEGTNTAALQSACCTALTELSLDDTAAHHIVQENGIYIIAKLILQQNSGPSVSSLQCYAFRALRFLFSVERNRHHFKRLFPTDLFELFIDVGHYVRDLTAYEQLQTKVSGYTEEELDSLRESINTADQNRPALKTINGYSVLDHLGTGAFGSVFKVRKQSCRNPLALKEVNLHNPAFGKDKRSRDSNVQKIISELTIIKEQMNHPNIVKYYKTFLEGEKLYIVMELIEGVPLAEHFNSLKEKHRRLSEDRIWNIFIQMCLALRYLHKEKRIVHRDLTPNNVMLGESDKVTIADFGLAKQKQENSKLTSVVGTILYSCPEVVKSEPYGEKADVWALGCILYQMATLHPPFYSSNMLSLASKIVEGVYEPVAEGAYSERVGDMIRWCLSPDPECRPDIVDVSSRISDLMMRLMDGLRVSHEVLERRAERDRKRAQKYFLEWDKNRTSCCWWLFGQETPPVKSDSAAARLSASCTSRPHNRRLSDSPSPLRNQRTMVGSRCFSEDVSDEDVETSITKTTHLAEGNGLTSTAEQSPPGGDFAAARTRPKAASGRICVSQKKLRQINDPIHGLLLQLHKIIFITQLPPAPHHNTKRRAVERFKKSLFQVGSHPRHLKAELSKLVQASPEPVEWGSGSPDWWTPVHPVPGDLHAAGCSGRRSLGDGVTYEQMKGLIEELLEENRYYEAAPMRVAEDTNDQRRSDH